MAVLTVSRFKRLNETFSKLSLLTVLVLALVLFCVKRSACAWSVWLGGALLSGAYPERNWKVSA